MNIAIDVHTLGSRAGGNETYFQHLVQGLAATPSDDHYTLFYTHPEALSAAGGDPRFRFVRIAQNAYLRNAISLPRRVAELKPDLFHCQYARPPLVRSKVVVTIHDIAFEHYPEHFHPLEVLRLKLQVRSTARSAEHILTVSQAAARDISALYKIPAGKITVASPGVSKRFHPREKQSSQAEIVRRFSIAPPFLLYVGRIQARKNLPRLVEAFARVKRSARDLRLAIVGKQDWQSKDLSPIVRGFRLEDSVVVPGYLTGDDLPIFYNAAEAFVFPSIFEGFGLPVVEAMASALPVVTSRGSALGEIAGDAAMLVDPSSVDSIAEGIEQVLFDAELRRRLVERGLGRASQFTVERFVATVRQVYGAVAGGGSTPPIRGR